MSGIDDIKNKAQDAAGTGKEKLGEATGNESMANDGRSDQAEAGMKKAGENVKDAVGDAKDSIKDAFDK